MQYAKHSRMMQIVFQNVDYLAPVDKSDVLVIPTLGYDLVVILQWFLQRIADIDWAHC